MRASARLFRTHLILVIAVAAMLWPIVVMLATSLKGPDELFRWPPSLLPHDVQWGNYAEAWSGRFGFRSAFVNSVIIATGTSVLALVLGAPAAYVAARIPFRGRRFFLFAVLATQMISPVVFIVPLYQVMRSYELLNTRLSVIIAGAAFAVPMVVWLLNGYFRRIPVDMEEAALVDGCSRLQALRRVVIPLAAPGMAAAGIYAFIVGWNEFIFALAFVSDSQLMPITVSLYNFSAGHVIFWHLMMAAAAIGILPVALLFGAVQRQMVRGLTAGSTK